MFINYLRLLPESPEVTRVNARCDITYFMYALSRHSTLARKYLGDWYKALKYKMYGKRDCFLRKWQLPSQSINPPLGKHYVRYCTPPNTVYSLTGFIPDYHMDVLVFQGCKFHGDLNHFDVYQLTEGIPVLHTICILTRT